MERLGRDEAELHGSWITIDNQVIGDPVSTRIDYLVSNELIELGNADGGWSTLYRDPVDGRYWELSHPQGEMRGGGPRSLIRLNPEVAKRKYDLS